MVEQGPGTPALRSQVGTAPDETGKEQPERWEEK